MGHLEVQDTQIHRPETPDSLPDISNQVITVAYVFALGQKIPNLSALVQRERGQGNQRKK